MLKSSTHLYYNYITSLCNTVKHYLPFRTKKDGNKLLPIVNCNFVVYTFLIDFFVALAIHLFVLLTYITQHKKYQMLFAVSIFEIKKNNLIINNSK